MSKITQGTLMRNGGLAASAAVTPHPRSASLGRRLRENTWQEASFIYSRFSGSRLPQNPRRVERRKRSLPSKGRYRDFFETHNVGPNI